MGNAGSRGSGCPLNTGRCCQSNNEGNTSPANKGNASQANNGNASPANKGNSSPANKGNACPSNTGNVFPAVMHGLAEVGTAVGKIIAASRSGGSGSSDNRAESVKKVVRDPALVGVVTEYQSQNAQLLDQFDKIQKQIKDQGLESKIESFEDLRRFDEKCAAALVELAKKTKAIKLEGRNFGLFGITSTGKSTIINQLLGRNVAAVGAGETTTQIEKYEGENFNLYDIPGRNDEMNYFTMEYISFWKGLTNRLIVITATFKEMTKVLSLLDAINLPYDIVVNKFDNVPTQERESFKEKIRKEVQTLRLKGVKHIWFVSASNPENFPDWSDMKNDVIRGE